jgi:hypothetical protein
LFKTLRLAAAVRARAAKADEIRIGSVRQSTEHASFNRYPVPVFDKQSCLSREAEAQAARIRKGDSCTRSRHRKKTDYGTTSADPMAKS